MCIYIYVHIHNVDMTHAVRKAIHNHWTKKTRGFLIVLSWWNQQGQSLLYSCSKLRPKTGRHMADTDSYIITKTMGNLMQFVFIASNVIMAIYNQTYLRVYRLTQDSVIPPVAILTGTTMFGPWNFGATILGQNLSSCTISNTDWRLYPHWMGFYINGKIIEVKWTKWWFFQQTMFDQQRIPLQSFA